MEADKAKLNIVREAGDFKRTAIMQGEIVSLPNKVNDIQHIVNFVEGNQMT